MAPQAPAVLHPTVIPPQISAVGTTTEDVAEALLYQHRVVSSYGFGVANSAQVTEANRYKLDVEREVHPDVNIPGGTPAWAQGMVTSIGALNNKLDTMNDTLTALRHSTSSVRYLALANNQAATHSTILSPVPHETTGEMPPDIFPRSLEVLAGMPSADVNGLLSYYELSLQGSVSVRRKRLMQAIGVRTDV